MDFIARLHHLLFQVEECLREARLLLRQGEHGLIYDLQAQRGADPFPTRVGDAEIDMCIAARFVASRHPSWFRSSDRPPAARKPGDDRRPAAHRGRRGRRRYRACPPSPPWPRAEPGLPVLQVEIARQNRLPIAHDVDVGRATGAGGEHFQFNRFAGLDHGVVDAQQDLVGACRVSSGTTAVTRAPR